MRVPRRLPLMALTGAITASLLLQPAATADPAQRLADRDAPPTQVTKSVPVTDLTSTVPDLPEVAAESARGTHQPATGSRTLTLIDPDGTDVDAGEDSARGSAGDASDGIGDGLVAASGLGVAVGTAEADGDTDARARAGSQEAAAVRVATAALPADLPGLAVTLEGSAGQDLTVAVDLSQFGNRFGGDWASRVQLHDVTACPQSLQCGTLVAATRTSSTAEDSAGAGAGGDGEELPGTVLTSVVQLHPDGPATKSTTGETRTGTGSGSGTDDAVLDGAALDGAGSGGAGLGGTVVLAAMAGASGSAGDFTATDLSASGTWSAGGQGGEMSWSYPLRVPPAASGLVPELALSYSSGSVDGRTTSTNNQPSWVGEGFSLPSGFIERRYVGCADDQGTGNNNPTKTGDLCWKSDPGNTSNQKWDNATVSFGAHSGELVRVANTSTWRLRTDDGSRFEKLTGASNGDAGGEYWKMTTPDGTQYYFGQHKPNPSATELTNSTWTVPVFGNHLGEPGYNASFASSSSTRAYRWNLDRVVTADGDAMTYYYTRETNRYQRMAGMAGASSVEYVRGGYLTRIDYGQRAGAEHTAAGARVTFAVVERCDNITYPSCQSTSLTASTAVQWPDLPYDQICTSTTSCSATTQGSPSFFSRKRLHTVTTSVRNAAGTGYDNVDRWTLSTAFPSPGDGSTAALALTSIAQSGLGGVAINLPPVTFHTAVWENRVDGIDDASPLNKHRVYAILTGTGEYLTWEYSAKDCTPSTVPTPHTNTKRCFPVYWTPPGQSTPALHWFHKYLVTSVTRTDLSGASAHPQSYSYTYTGSPAWAYEDSVLTPAKYRTWSQWRGYELVKVTAGAAGHTRSHSETRYFRGMHGDRATPSGGTKTVSVTDSEGTAVTDHWRLQGQARETITYNGPGGAVVSKELYEPWTTSPVTANDGVRTAMYAGVSSTKVTTPRTTGPARVSQSITAYDTSGFPTSVSDLGDLTIAGDDVCTRTSYTRNTTAHILDTVSETRTTAGACTLDPGTAPLLEHDRFYYDGAASTTSAPTRGNLTKTEQLVDTGSGQSWRALETTTYDIHGRPTASTDAAGKTSTISYTPATGTPLTSITTTSPDPDDGGPLTAHTSSTTLDRRWGAPISATAPNQGLTEASLDALGRTTAVWLPGRDRAAHPSAPSAKYAYLLQAAGPNAVTAQTLTANSTYTTAITILDGLLRPRQSQSTPAAGAGRVITDTLYDSRGNPVKTRGPLYNSASAPSTTPVTFSDAASPLTVEQVLDGAGRVTDEITKVHDVEKWRTTTSYGGDRVNTTPPAGGTPTTTILDVDGNTTALLEYTGATPTGTARTTSYTYDRLGRMTAITDAAGNTWGYTYNLQGDLTATADPDKGATTMAYDALGRLTASTDARGITLRHTYDHLSRKTATTNNDGTPRATWTYDTLPGGGTAKGLLTGATRHTAGAQITTAITGYTPAGQPTGTSTTIPAITGTIPAQLAGTYTTSHTYKPDGSLATTTLPAAGTIPAETLTYTYTDTGQPRQLSSPNGGAYVADTIYNSYGQLTQLTMGNTIGRSLYHTFAYEDGTGRLAQAILDRQSSPTTDETISYTYDPSGRPTRTHAALADGTSDTQCYRYGERSQLSEAWTPVSGNCATNPTQGGLGGPAPYWQSWTHDIAGNILTITDRTTTTSNTTTLTYPAPGSPRPHFATAATTTGATANTRTFTADAAGNTTTRTKTATPTQSLTWDPEGHLATVTTGTGPTTTIAAYLYDPDGNRLLRTENGQATLYLGATEITADTTNPAAPATGTRYYTHTERTIATRTGPAKSHVTSLFTDPQNTATHAVSNTTSVVTTRRTTPYGAPRQAPVGWPGDHGFLDGPTDTSTALTHLGAREYDPTLARFLSVDPLLDTSEPLHLNSYTYALNNPTTLADPDGRIPRGMMLTEGYTAASAPKTTTTKTATTGNTTQRTNNTSSTQPKKNPTTSHGDDRRSPRQGSTKTRPVSTPVKKTTQTKPVSQPKKQSFWGRVGGALWEGAKEISGYNDGKACITEGDLAACAWFAVGFIPGGKFAKGAKIALDTATTIRATTKATNTAVPTVVFSRSRAPGIAGTFDDAVANGAPTQLNRVGTAARDANRRAALRGQSPAPAGQSLDEYPFACSAQGGCGATVRSVPVGEQSYQGGVLSRFFQDNGVGVGDPFNVKFGP